LPDLFSTEVMSETDPRYELYIFDVSYFSGKLEAYFRYREIPYTRIEPTWWQMVTLICAKTGLMQVPVVHDKLTDNWMRDTTPIIEYFEHSESRPLPVFPDCPVQNFFSRLLEDYADEWLWRPALFYRWEHQEDRELYSIRFTNEFLRDSPFPRFFTKALITHRQYNHYVIGDGIKTETTKKHVRSVYTDTLTHLQKHFETHDYLLGDHPTISDFGFFASMFRHFSIDPTPAKLMRSTAPAVYEWVARLWNASQSTIQRKSKESSQIKTGTIPETWSPILRMIGSQYLPYLHANAVNYSLGKTHFDFHLGGVTYHSLPVVPYRVASRLYLQEQYAKLSPEDKKIVKEVLETHQCFESLLRDGVIEIKPTDENEVQLAQNRKNNLPPVWKTKTLTRTQTLLLYLIGTPWHSCPSFLQSKLFSFLP